MDGEFVTRVERCVLLPYILLCACVCARRGLKSWFVSLDIGAVWSTEISAKPEDIIYGNMTRLSGNTWFIGGVNTRTKQATTITVSHARLQLQPWYDGLARWALCCSL